MRLGDDVDRDVPIGGRKDDHPEFGEIVVPTTPLRLHGTDKVDTRPSPTIGQHNTEIYGGWLGLGVGEIADLRETGVI
jgi:CoA:oxalate CoA-transferase